MESLSLELKTFVVDFLIAEVSLGLDLNSVLHQPGLDVQRVVPFHILAASSFSFHECAAKEWQLYRCQGVAPALSPFALSRQELGKTI